MNVDKELKQLYGEASEEVGILRGFFLEAARDGSRRDLRSLSATLKDLRSVQVRILYAMLKLEEPSEEDLTTWLAGLPVKTAKKVEKWVAVHGR
ncbi:MAG: hypothetical protein HYU39_04370 [Thaumarchaeota archaeon]|nr:hypothetical protein [Nitrososphaerota archaeon]